jgi:hypothetical protein
VAVVQTEVHLDLAVGPLDLLGVAFHGALIVHELFIYWGWPNM